MVRNWINPKTTYYPCVFCDASIVENAWMVSIVQGAVGKRLRYADLIADVISPQGRLW